VPNNVTAFFSILWGILAMGLHHSPGASTPRTNSHGSSSLGKRTFIASAGCASGTPIQVRAQTRLNSIPSRSSLQVLHVSMIPAIPLLHPHARDTPTPIRCLSNTKSKDWTTSGREEFPRFSIQHDKNKHKKKTIHAIP